VAPGSAGERAGIKPGDIVTAINLRPITNAADLEKAIVNLTSGSRVTIEFLRREQRLKAELVL